MRLSLLFIEANVGADGSGMLAGTSLYSIALPARLDMVLVAFLSKRHCLRLVIGLHLAKACGQQYMTKQGKVMTAIIDNVRPLISDARTGSVLWR